MSYADLIYYKDTYRGYDPDDDREIGRALERATDDIALRCGNELVESDYTALQWENVKKANCAQAEYYLLNGEAYNENGGAAFSLGKFNFSGAGANRSNYSARFRQYLSMSGVCSAAVTVRGRGCYCDPSDT